MSEHVCGVPDQLGSGNDCRWPDGQIPYAITHLIPGVSEEDYRQEFQWAAVQLHGACGVRLHEIESAARARLLLTTRKMDGAGGVLAEAQLPCGNVRQCPIWCDSSERWLLGWTWGQKIPQGMIPLGLVLLHEGMHALGLPHTSEPRNVMNPSLQTGLSGLGRWDVQELRRRYGNATAPSPDPGDKMGDFLKVLMQLAKFLADNPELLELLKRLLGKAMAGQNLTMEDVRVETHRVEQLRVP